MLQLPIQRDFHRLRTAGGGSRTPACYPPTRGDRRSTILPPGQWGAHPFATNARQHEASGEFDVFGSPGPLSLHDDRGRCPLNERLERSEVRSTIVRPPYRLAAATP